MDSDLQEYKRCKKQFKKEAEECQETIDEFENTDTANNE